MSTDMLRRLTNCLFIIIIIITQKGVLKHSLFTVKGLIQVLVTVTHKKCR